MWAHARLELRLSDDEFLSLTMRQFNALCRAHQAHERREDLRFGVLCSLIQNVNRGSDDAPSLQPHDFFPSLPKPPAKRERKQSPEQMLSFMRSQKNYQRESR